MKDGNMAFTITEPISFRINLDLLAVTQNSLSVVGPNLWDTIPAEIQNCPSKNSFKFNYKKYLLSFYDSINI